MKKGCYLTAVLTIAWFVANSSTPSQAVAFYNTGDPQHNTTAPSGDLAESGWHLQGDSFAGIPIAPNFFISATHAGGKIGDTFTFRGVAYAVLSKHPHPDADITVWQVAGSFPEYATLYSSKDEVGQPLVVFGRGCQRGEEVWHNGKLKGWTWGQLDGQLRWGENVVAGISDGDGNPATAETKFQLLRADFDANAGANEAHLSGGDSSGGVFIRDGGVWKLAGVNHAANHEYGESATGTKFDATLFDEGGFFEGEEGEREFRQESSAGAQPGSFYATRISAYLPWIQSIISGGGETPTPNPVPDTPLVLQQTTNLLEPYSAVSEVVIDPVRRLITIPRPAQTHFYRVIGDQPYVIRRMITAGNELNIFY